MTLDAQSAAVSFQTNFVAMKSSQFTIALSK